jgi:hypothetical protein
MMIVLTDDAAHAAEFLDQLSPGWTPHGVQIVASVDELGLASEIAGRVLLGVFTGARHNEYAAHDRRVSLIEAATARGATVWERPA